MWFMSLARRKGHLIFSGGFVMQYYQRSRFPFVEEETLRVTHRFDRSIPGCVPAHDIWIFNDDPARDPDRLYMTIKNPSKPYRPSYLT